MFSEEKIEKRFSTFWGSGITLTNNEVKYIVQVIPSLENTGILLKGTTQKVSQKGGLDYLIFLLHLQELLYH